MNETTPLTASQLGLSGEGRKRVGILEKTTLPTDQPEHLVVTPTLDRWKSNGHRGPLPQLVASVQEALRHDRLSNTTWIVLGDGSSYEGVEQDRERALNQICMTNEDARVFILTPETQAQVAQCVRERTGLREAIVNVLLTDTGYASQRAKLDLVAGGVVLESGRAIKVLGLDDDIVIPREWGMLRPTSLPQGLEPKPNSQTLITHESEDFPDDKFERRNGNSLIPFFENLGKRVLDVREARPRLRATKHWKDTMHSALDEAIQGKPAQFVVSSADEDDMPGAENARIVAASATKSIMPDYRTVRIASAYLQSEFPESEIPIKSFPSGEAQPFAFHQSHTNVDSAALSRLITPETALWPWWFISSVDLSLSNPLKTVTGHYRADNELLPVLLNVMKRKPGSELQMYLAGLDTQVFHLRAKSGYRPGMHEQASSSLIGNIAAIEAANRLEWDPVTGKAKLYQVDADYKAPQEQTQRAFDEMRNLADICAAKIFELRAREEKDLNSAEQKRVGDAIMKYAKIQLSIAAKLAGFDFAKFYQHLSEEVRDQLKFYGEVLNAMPQVTDEARNLIRLGKYPIVEFKLK